MFPIFIEAIKVFFLIHENSTELHLSELLRFGLNPLNSTDQSNRLINIKINEYNNLDNNWL